MSAERRNTALEAVGKWSGILSAFGVESRLLTGKHCPCPMCGGKDRFRFDDKKGLGTWFCSQCGSGTGFDLLMRLKDWDFRKAAHEVDHIIGTVSATPVKPERPLHSKVRALRKIWDEARALTRGDPVDEYLRGRGIVLGLPARDLQHLVDDALRYHHALPYRTDDGRLIHFAAMIARVTDADGAGVTLHRTYLERGKKAPVDSPRKLMTPIRTVTGAAVRLFPVAARLGVAEGLETALSAAAMFGVPTWSTVNAHGLETFQPPAQVKQLVIFGDADESWTGQAAATLLAKRMVAKGLSVKVKLPPMGKDWNDVLLNQPQHQEKV